MKAILRLLPVFLLALVALRATAGTDTLVAAERPDCADEGPRPEALCPCLIEQRWREAGSLPEIDLDQVECSVETHDQGVAVLTVGGYELYGFSYDLAIRAGEVWHPVATLGEKATSGTGGHYSDFEVEEVRVIERGPTRLLRVQGRGNDGYWHFDGSQGSTDVVTVTLCTLPDSPDEPPGCPLQVPILIDREWSDPHDEDQISDEEPPVDAAEADPLGEGEDDSELDSRMHEKTVRLEVRVSADGATAEVVLIEGDLEGDALQEKLGVHSLLDE